MKRFILSCAALALMLPACTNQPQVTATQPTPSAQPQQVVATEPASPEVQPSQSKVYYLASHPGQPVPKDPVLVSDKATAQALNAAAQSQDRAKFIKIAKSNKIMFLPGGAIVQVLSKSGDLVQVDLMSRDIYGNDVSTKTGWTSVRYLQEMMF